MSQMFNPPHPGETLREDVLPALGVSVTKAAEQLGISRITLSRVLNEHAGISPDMALRIEKWLGPENGGSAEVWLRMQLAHDLWVAKKAASAKLSSVKHVKLPEKLALA